VSDQQPGGELPERQTPTTGEFRERRQWITVSTGMTRATGVHTVYLTFVSPSGWEIGNINWITFRRDVVRSIVEPPVTRSGGAGPGMPK